MVAQAGDAEHLLRRTLAHRPDVAIVDVQMPPRRENDGLLAAIELRRRLPQTGVRDPLAVLRARRSRSS